MSGWNGFKLDSTCLVDAFLHQLHTGTTALRNLVQRVNTLIEEKIETNIASIKNMIFFDYELAFSKSWVPTCN